MGEVVGFESITSAIRMNSAVVIFLDEVKKVEQVVKCGVVVRDSFTPVFPLVSPAKKITISNAPPFIKNENLSKALSRYGQLVSPIKMVPLGCKSPKLKHVVCRRGSVYMLPKDADSQLNLTLTFSVKGFNYVIFVTSEMTMKCFGCGAEGHPIRACPKARQVAGGSGSERPVEEAGGSGPGMSAAEAGGSGPSQPALEAAGSGLGLPAIEAAGSGSVRPVAGVVVNQTEEEHPGESCSPVASQGAEKTGQDGLNGLNMQEETQEGQTVKGMSDNSVTKEQTEKKGRKCAVMVK